MTVGPSQYPLFCGYTDPPPPRIALRAGPLSLFFENGDLRYIRLGDQEVLRRIYVAVRDAAWGTVPVSLSDIALRSTPDSFRITFLAEHCDGGIGFNWQGVIEGRPDGTIVFEMKGEALTTFLRNRIGICVLHPVDGCAGKACMIEKTDGSRHRGSFPRSIAPHQPFKDMCAIEHQPAPGVRLRVEFLGEVFEMEDQRNWTDDSYKTYSTPLELPFPVEIKRGTRVEQSVVVRLSHSAALRTKERPGQRLSLEMSRASKIPRIGLGIASHGEDLSPKQVSRLAALRLSHLRVDIHLSHPEWEPRLEQAASQAGRLGIGLEVALFLADSAKVELRQLATRITQLGPRIDSWLILRTGRQPVPPAWIAGAREILKPAAPEALFGSGTDAYYAEWNRNRPSFEVLELSCYSANPQVHAFDNSTLVENLQGLRHTAVEASRISRGVPLAISPVTLRPRPPADAPLPLRKPVAGALPPGVDPRQASLLGAGWTACSLKYLAVSGVRSITYYETSGMRGVMGREEAQPSSFPSQPGSVFPLYHALADFGAYAGGVVIETLSNDPLRFDGVALKRGSRVAVILVSWIPEPQRVLITGIFAATRVRRLNAASAEIALFQPERYRAALESEISASTAGLEVTLEPFEVARLEIPGEEN